MSTVVVLLSDKRSGSTMFQEELCRHPGVQTVAYSPHTYLETHWWLMGAVLLDRPGPLFVSGSRYDGYGTPNNARAYMVDLLSKCVPDFNPPSDDRALVFKGWEALASAYAKPIFFEKSPQFLSQWAAISLLLEWADETDFDVKIIGLVRNPHAVMYSAAELFGSAPETRQFAWLAGCRNLFTLKSLLPDDQFYALRYEDLVADPVGGFARIAEFIGVDPYPACGSGVHSSSTEKWKQDPDHTLLLDVAVRQVAEKLGYTDAELMNQNGRVPATGALSRRAPAPSAKRINRLRHTLVKPLVLRLRALLKVQG